MTTPHVQYYVTQKPRPNRWAEPTYGVHVSELTKDEASELLAATADIQCKRQNGSMSASQYGDIVSEIGTPRVERSSTAYHGVMWVVISLGALLAGAAAFEILRIILDNQ